MTSFKRTQRKYVQKAYRVRNWREYETGVKGGAKLDHRGGGKLDHPAVEWLKAAVRRRGQDAGAAAGWRAFLLCSRR